MKKLAVIFPGIGYHSDKPLLYYAKKLVKKRGFEVVEVAYGELPEEPKKAMAKTAQMAAVSAAETLNQIDFDAYDCIVFISKSIGTAVASMYEMEMSNRVFHVYFTPVTVSLPMLSGEGIVFTGTSDPWVDTDDVCETCEMKGFPCFVEEDANHSLETGDVKKDLNILEECISHLEEFLDMVDPS